MAIWIPGIRQVVYKTAFGALDYSFELGGNKSILDNTNSDAFNSKGTVLDMA